MREEIKNETGLVSVSKIIYETLDEQGLNKKEIIHFFDGYKKTEIYKYFSNKKNEKVLSSVRVKHFDVDDVIEVIKLFSKKKDFKIKSTYVTYSQMLFFFFYVIQKVEIKDLWFFIEKLYCAADHNFDLFMFKNVKDIILFNTIRLNQKFEFWKSELEYWEEHKQEYVPNLQLPPFVADDSTIIIAKCDEGGKKKTISPRTAILYEQWRKRLLTKDDLEDEQKTRLSIRIINHEATDWKGFVADSPEKTKKIIELVLDSGNRRIYYFNKLVDQIIKAQERCEDREAIKEYLLYVAATDKKTGETCKCIKIDGLLKILNSAFDGVSKCEKNALGNYNERVIAFSDSKLLSKEEIDKQIYEKLGEYKAVEDPSRRRRKYIYAYVVGEYKEKNEKDKEVVISKELLLMMVLVLKVLSPDTYSIADVEKMLLNSRYGGELGQTLFEQFFLSTFSELHEKGVALRVQKRFSYVQKQSAKYELMFLRQKKTPFADAIMCKETYDGK